MSGTVLPVRTCDPCIVDVHGASERSIRPLGWCPCPCHYWTALRLRKPYDGEAQYQQSGRSATQIDRSGAENNA